MKRLAPLVGIIALIAAIALTGCSTGKQTITFSISAWGVEFAPTFETENITLFVDPIIVTNTVCGCACEPEKDEE